MLGIRRSQGGWRQVVSGQRSVFSIQPNLFTAKVAKGRKGRRKFRVSCSPLRPLRLSSCWLLTA